MLDFGNSRIKLRITSRRVLQIAPSLPLLFLNPQKDPMLHLNPMTQHSFGIFQKDSQTTYATDLAHVENIPLEEALKYTSEQFTKLVPAGLQTPGQLFFDVIEATSRNKVGYLWLGIQNRFGKVQASINDIKIYPEYRGKGFAKKLMNLAEAESKSKGAARVRLHVFNHNIAAKSLYLAMGFLPTSLDMRKELRP